MAGKSGLHDELVFIDQSQLRQRQWELHAPDETERRPHVLETERLTVDDLRVVDDGIVLVRVKFGYSDTADVPRMLGLAAAGGLEVDLDNISYFITRSIIKAEKGGPMSVWRKRLFIAVNRNSGSPTRYFRLPESQVISMGSTIVI